MINKIFLTLSASILALSITSANAEVKLNDTPSPREREIVNVMFASYLADRPGTSIQTAVIDMDGDNLGEIITRFVHSSSCDAELKKCRTAISKFNTQRNRWEIIFDRPSHVINKIEKGNILPGDIQVDDIEWTYNAINRSFKPSKSKNWSNVEWKEVDKPLLEGYAAFFGQGAETLAKENRGITVSYTRDGLSQKNDLILLKLTGNSVCGQKIGCPIRLIKKNGDNWDTILNTASPNETFTLPTERAGYNDIILQTENGFVSFGWNGNNYSVAETIESARNNK